jgi:hypothetical protein
MTKPDKKPTRSILARQTPRFPLDGIRLKNYVFKGAIIGPNSS